MLNYESRVVWLATAFESDVLIGLRLVKHADDKERHGLWLVTVYYMKVQIELVNTCTVMMYNMRDAASAVWKWWFNKVGPLLGQSDVVEKPSDAMRPGSLLAEKYESYDLIGAMMKTGLTSEEASDGVTRFS
jgi:hypothetical protein